MLHSLWHIYVGMQKGKVSLAIFISSMIIGVLLAQAINLNITQGFYVYHFMEVLTWIVGTILLRRKPKEYAIVIGLSVVIAFVYSRLCRIGDKTIPIYQRVRQSGKLEGG